LPEDYRTVKVFLEQGVVFLLTIHVFYLPLTDNNGSGELLTIKLNVQQGFHRQHVSFNQTVKPLQTGNTLLSQSAGVVWGDRHCHLSLLASASYIMSD
jgi:hypothetical protein